MGDDRLENPAVNGRPDATEPAGGTKEVKEAAAGFETGDDSDSLP